MMAKVFIEGSVTLISRKCMTSHTGLVPGVFQRGLILPMGAKILFSGYYYCQTGGYNPLSSPGATPGSTVSFDVKYDA